jgi:LacI family transcriptional regulator
MRTKPVTMSDLARHLGVSRSAVSFALNNENQVSEETRERVLAKAAELGYRPNAGARGLAASKTDLFALVTDIVTTPFAGDLIAGAQDAFWKKGKSLIIAGTTTPESPDERSIDLILEHRVGGIMFATTTNRAIELPAVLDGIPIVLVHCFDPSGAHNSVIPDEERGGFSATNLLLERGRRRIGMINLEADLPAAQGRKAGYLAALAAAGVEPEPEWIVEGGAESDGGYAAALALLSSQQLDGLFCANDRLAMGAYDAARELGIDIPNDLSVVGFDNQEIIAKYVRPALSTVALPFREMGRIGAEIVMRDPDDEPATVVVDCPVVIRNSV